MSSKPTIYHEKQVKELCALHALNNLFQKGSYSKSELDAICSRLSPNVWINPHRSMLGLGNYDINVIMAALQKKDCEAIWFDKRKDPACLNLSHISGFILNVPSDYKLGFVMLPLRRRHWIAIRQIQGNFYNLDSKLEVPQLIGRSSELIAYLKEQLECKEKEMFVIVSKEVEQKHLWINQTLPNANDQQLANHSPAERIASFSTYDYNNRDAECLRITEVRNCVVSRENF
ncbi:josephin-2 isoform X2 [Pectinophora gossypiella]|uniref:josephin-2 isoform X2 n=1 Tax=Pectinophora gossypiella TaxID=13191 RepID=UPI00214F217D|nr:josephin-2 isoform X2 [Pectinophora gossypiella]